MMHKNILLLGFSLFALSMPSQANEMEFQQCQVTQGAISVSAECADFSRLENPKDPNGDKIILKVVKFPSHSPDPAIDAFTIIQGGPGGSSIDLYLSMQGVFNNIRSKRDILVVDQRGTGRSNMLACSQSTDLSNAAFDIELTRKAALQCLDNLSSNPAFYTTSLAVDDLEAIRKAAGYPQFSFYGVSYGTRVALHYLRKYPESVRALILDGVADVGLNLAGSEIALRSDQAFNQIISRCQNDKACFAEFGNVQTTFNELKSKLAHHSVVVDLPHPVSGKMTQQTLTEQHLLAFIRLMAYSTETVALLPFMLHQANQGEFVPLAASVLRIDSSLSKNFAQGTNNTVVCAEDMPFIQESDLQGAQDTFLGTLVQDSIKATCDVWPKGPVDQDLRTPFLSDKPTLLISGEADPITPPENAERALTMLSNGLHIEVPGHGHGVVGRGCAAQLAAQFIEQASVKNLQVACVQREIPVPFFLSPSSPAP